MTADELRGAVYLHSEPCQCLRGEVTSVTGGLLPAGERAQTTLAVCVVRAGREGCVLADGTVTLDLEE